MDIKHFNLVKEHMDLFNLPAIQDFSVERIIYSWKVLKNTIILKSKDRVISDICYLLYYCYMTLHNFRLFFNNEEDYCKKYDGERKDNVFDNTSFNSAIKKTDKICIILTKNCILFKKSAEKEEIDEDKVQKLIIDIYNDIDTFIQLSYNLGYLFGYDMDHCFNITHASNMSRACKTEDEAKESIISIKNKGICKNPIYLLSKNCKYYVLLDEDGIMLDSINYKPADYN